MLLKQSVVDALNQQVVEEFSAAAQYIAISLNFEDETLPELAAYFDLQAREEHSHAMKILRYIGDLGSKGIVPATRAPVNHFESAAETVELALNQEIKVTQQINALLDLARSENDHLTHQFLQWFVTEQIEEVSSMSDLLNLVRRAGEDNLLLVEEFLARNPHSEAGGSAAGNGA
jgi:bacterioferritin B